MVDSRDGRRGRGAFGFGLREMSRAFNLQAPKDVSSLRSLAPPTPISSGSLKRGPDRLAFSSTTLHYPACIIVVSVEDALFVFYWLYILISVYTYYYRGIISITTRCLSACVITSLLSLSLVTIPLLKPSTFICALPLTRLRHHTTILVSIDPAIH